MGFLKRPKNLKKIFFVLLTRASCSVRATAYLSKSRRRLFKTNVVMSDYTNFMICRYTTKSFIEIPPCAKKVIFITEFGIWWQNPSFYEVKKVFQKRLCAWRNLKIIFSRPFSSSFLGRKYYFGGTFLYRRVNGVFVATKQWYFCCDLKWCFICDILFLLFQYLHTFCFCCFNTYILFTLILTILLFPCICYF